jgi:hypothetical protein
MNYARGEVDVCVFPRHETGGVALPVAKKNAGSDRSPVAQHMKHAWTGRPSGTMQLQRV